MTEQLLLDASGVAKNYGAVAALRNASLSVRPGEVHALMGANGAVILGDARGVEDRCSGQID